MKKNRRYAFNPKATEEGMKIETQNQLLKELAHTISHELTHIAANWV